jgi:hypothetical protein
MSHNAIASLLTYEKRSPLHDLRLRKPIAASSQNDAIALQKNNTIAFLRPQEKRSPTSAKQIALMRKNPQQDRIAKPK